MHPKIKVAAFMIAWGFILIAFNFPVMAQIWFVGAIIMAGCGND